MDFQVGMRVVGRPSHLMGSMGQRAATISYNFLSLNNLPSASVHTAAASHINWSLDYDSSSSLFELNHVGGEFPHGSSCIMAAHTFTVCGTLIGNSPTGWCIIARVVIDCTAAVIWLLLSTSSPIFWTCLFLFLLLLLYMPKSQCWGHQHALNEIDITI